MNKIIEKKVFLLYIEEKYRVYLKQAKLKIQYYI